MPKYRFTTVKMPEELGETLDVIGQLLQNTCKSIKLDLEKKEIVSYCNLSENEPPVPEVDPDYQTLFDTVELESLSSKDLKELPRVILQAMQIITANGYHAAFWVVDGTLNLKAKLGWDSIVSLRSGFLGLPLYKTDLREYNNTLVLYGTRLQGMSLTSAQFGVVINL
jgi:hypothetical protein